MIDFPEIEMNNSRSSSPTDVVDMILNRINQPER